MRSDIRIFKFGGASVRDADAVRNVARIVTQRQDKPLVIVISAMGKMTNALEGLATAYYDRESNVAGMFQAIRQFHWDIARQLFPADHAVFEDLNDLFVEVEWVLEEDPPDDYNYMYDQIVPVGELLSSRMVSAFLVDSGIDVHLVDARDIIKTDNSYREARINWQATEQGIRKIIPEHLEQHRAVITQGFIGCTSENFTSTLGREGSDYSAAILAFCLDALDMTIWKDVPGVLTADPKHFENVELIDRMTYKEAVEMTYYGATVIHPKTIKPLQNKSIPLYVKSFDDPAGPGTWIGTDLESVLPPIIVLAEGQALIHISVKDYSFVAEHHLSMIFQLFARERIKINLMRNTAISFTVCCRHDIAKIQSFRKAVEDKFTVVVDKGLSLFTIRHANQKTIDFILAGKVVVLEEKFQETVQYVTRDAPVMSPRT